MRDSHPFDGTHGEALDGEDQTSDMGGAVEHALHLLRVAVFPVKTEIVGNIVEQLRCSWHGGRHRLHDHR